MRTAIYIRVSTEEQANEGYSISAQRDRLTAYVQSQDWEIYDYYVDEGFSAKDTNRPALQRLFKDAIEKRFDVVLVYKLDRFTRNVKDLYTSLEKFEKYKIGFRSAQEQFDTTTPMGRAMMGMLGIFAQWERETIAERVYMGQEQMTLEGRRPGAPAPTGYDLVDGKLVINQEQAIFIRRLFDMYTNRMGMPAICKSLAEEGIKLSIATIHYIISNPVYCGKVRWNYRSDGNRTGNEIITDGFHEPIISVEMFEKAQETRQVREKRGRSATSDFPYSNIIKCGKCGSFLIGASRVYKTKRERFYRCSGKLYYGICDMPNVREEKIDAEFIRCLSADEQVLEKLIHIPDVPKTRDRIDKIEQELSQISSRRKRWQLAFANGLIEIEELRTYIEPDKEREAELKLLLSELPKAKTYTISKEEIAKQLSKVGEAWLEITDHYAKKKFLEDLFESITIVKSDDFKQKFGITITEWTLK